MEVTWRRWKVTAEARTEGGRGTDGGWVDTSLDFFFLFVLQEWKQLRGKNKWEKKAANHRSNKS